MKNQVKVTHKSMMVNFTFPIVVGQVKLDAIGQVFIYKNNLGQIAGDFEFIDQENETYMDMPVEGYNAWKKLKEFHNEFGVDLQKLISDEFYKIVNDDFEKEFLSQFDVKMFEF